jgi:catechol 2,3-dioxygenase-like lactoylglutathione lyase family enzyme
MTNAINTPTAPAMDMRLEVIVIPVSDVDRAKEFYGRLGWRLDADFAAGDDHRVIQFTPPGSGSSVIFGKNVTAAAPGSAKGLYLVVSDIKAARDDLLGRGVEVSEPFHVGADVSGSDEPYLLGRHRVRGADPESRSLSPLSRIRTATAGCSRRSPRACPVAWTPRPRPSPLRRSSHGRSAEHRPLTANTKRGSASMMRTGRTGMPTTSWVSRWASSWRHEP